MTKDISKIQMRSLQVSKSLFAANPQPIYKLPHGHRFHQGETFFITTCLGGSTLLR